MQGDKMATYQVLPSITLLYPVLESHNSSIYPINTCRKRLRSSKDKIFLFVVDGKGTVTMVHCHPEDHEELLIIKKAMVSVFSVHVKTEQDKRDWTYGIREKDHLGNVVSQELLLKHVLTRQPPVDEDLRRLFIHCVALEHPAETAAVMLDCLMKDEKYTVRQMALSVYVKHPRRREVTRPHEDSILSRNYTYPAVARVKRDMAEMILFQFKIQVPKLDWKKEIGTKDVGASFGVYFDNSIDGLFSK
nr:hypothetical protein BaRGS_027225 [Batillaria attramentaria]